MSDTKKPMEIVWVVTPHEESSTYDEWWGESRDEGTNEEDAREAAAYAHDRLSDALEHYAFGEGPATVTIEQREVESWETPWAGEEVQP